MVKKRKRPVAVVPPPLRSQKLARRITSRFHELTAEQALGRDVSVELRNLGGREAYQRASQLSTSLCRHTTKFMLSRLVKMGFGPRKKKTPVKVLEVGAVNTQLLNVSWVSTTAIDLQSTHPLIQQVDFFQLPQRGEFDVVVSSMVLNSVPTPVLRGEMLHGYRRHLRQRGLLFLMLPRKCIARVTGIPCHCFERMLNDVGFLLIEKKLSPKVAFFLYQVDELPPQPLGVAGTEGKSICNGNTKQESLAIPFGSEADNYSPSSYGVETDDDLYHVGWTGSEIELEVRNQPSFERMGWVGPGPVS